MENESIAVCRPCGGTGDQHRRTLPRPSPDFQQCPACRGEGNVLDLVEHEAALVEGKKLRLVAEGGKYQINGTSVTPRMYRAVAELALGFWDRQRSALEALPKKAEVKAVEEEGAEDAEREGA